jgi:cystathionine beta-lyase
MTVLTPLPPTCAIPDASAGEPPHAPLPEAPQVLARPRAVETFLSHGTRSPRENGGIVNPPVCHASTIVFDDMRDMARRRQAMERDEPGVMWYGRKGTPTTFALQESIAVLEGGYRTLLTSSGLSACIAALTALTRAGDHVLLSDSVYGPVRHYAQSVLARFGVEIGFYDPAAGGDIGRHFRPNTRVVYVESPGSQTFEIQDVPTIAEQAHRHGAKVVMDNTWASPLFFQPFEHGVDVSVQACTKYIIGHSDALMGAITATRECWPAIRDYADLSGQFAGPDDVYLAQRGLRTLSVRLRRHQENALKIAAWLATRPEVAQVLYPALPGAPGHELWKRDYRGASGLFGLVLKPCPHEALCAFVDQLTLFHLGFSWGGFESMIMPLLPFPEREASAWPYPGTTVRLHVGLESPDDLMADLTDGLERLRRTASRAR